MNDKIIIRNISKIYFAITSFLLFISLILSIIFVTLQNGLFIENISLQSLSVNKLYIKWNENLDISIKEIKIHESKTKTEPKLLVEQLSRELSKLSNYYNIFEKILIDKISHKEFTASFKYIRGEHGYLKASTANFTFKSSLSFSGDILNVQIDTFKDNKRDINIGGNIFLDTKKQSATTNLRLNIHNEINCNILAYINVQKFYYKIKSNKEIESISYLMKLLQLHPEVNYWANEAITFSKISLIDLYGWGSFNDLDNAYKNIYAYTVGYNLNYTYNKALDAIHTKQTDVIFKNGVLYIYPKEAYSYNSQLGKSWLKIDFTKKEELLSLKLLYDGMLDKETLGILEAYEIKIPFLQNSGLTNVDLNLDVNLRTIAVDAKGRFFAKKANFTYLGESLDVEDAYIKLNNYDVSINKMGVNYQNIAKSSVDVKYDAKTSQGSILIDFKQIDFKNLDFSLNIEKAPLKVSYLLAPQNDTLFIEASKWSFHNQEVNVDEISLPFDLKTLLLTLPKTNIKVAQIGDFSIAGTIDVKNSFYSFDTRIEDLHLENFSLTKPKKPTFKIIYDGHLSISSSEKIDFKINSLYSFINPFEILVKNNTISTNETYIKIDDILKTKLSLSYSFAQNKGELKTNRLQIQTQSLGGLYFERYDTNFDLLKTDDFFTLSSKDLDLFLKLNSKEWALDLHSLHRLARNSKLLQKYEVTKGKASIFKAANEKNLIIDSTLYSSNKIMVEENTPSDKYSIKGKVDTKKDLITLNINEKVKVLVGKKIFISLEDTGINLDALVDIVNAKGGDIKNYGSQIVNLEAKNTYLYISPTRHVLSDSISLHYADKILTASLHYKKGIAHIKFKNGYFHTRGEKFNDAFMQNLFSLSKFRDGDLQFIMSGTPKEFDGLITINNTTLLDYKVLNNVLAFVNTVPSLVTFSMPNYNKTGMQVQNAYMKFTSKENIFHISDLFLNSKELDILGKGNASFVNNSIDLKLNLKTDLGSSVSKIPLVGHILMGKDSVSTSLSISGALDNPDVKTLIARDIAVAPLNILLRTVTLPLYLLNSLEDNNTTKEKK